MKKELLTRILTLVLLISSVGLHAQVKDKIDWPNFMAQHDLVWDEIPLQWNECAFVGNGQVGMTFYAKMDENRFNFHIGRQDVTDHRKAPNSKTSMGVKGADLLDFSRLDIGKMALHPAGKILSATIRQDLWNAEVRGTIITDLGEITFRGFTPYHMMLNVIEVSSTEKKNGLYAPYAMEWMAGNASCCRVVADPNKKGHKEYVYNTNEPELSFADDMNTCTQKLMAGGDYATAWHEQKEKQKSTFYISTANEVPASGLSVGVAQQTVKDAETAGITKLEEQHREWWHTYFKKSFLTMPDTRMESFYWIQLYKMATCSRADGPALDLLGPFFKNTSWPGLWWNLNVQLTYWPFNTSNHLDIAENYIDLIDTHFEYMVNNKKGGSLGDFAWATHNYWLYFKYMGDEQAILEKWVPKAMEIAEIYETKLERNAQGQLELGAMGSPEFHGFASFKNTNYNLAIIRWMLNALIESNEQANQYPEEIAHWKTLLADLIPYPVDENGLMIGSEQAVDISHRHYSHLLALYPLFQLDPDSPEDRELVVKSVLHWHKIEDGKGLAGYSFTGASSLYAAMGMGDEAVDIMQDFLAGDIGKAHFLTNTFYMEGNNPVIETPLSGAAAIMEYSLQSWGNKLRVFPAIPSTWQDASFADLRGQGGFLVSATMSEGTTDWVAIESEAGQPCTLKVPGWKEAFQISKGESIAITKIADGEFSIALKEGQKIVLSSQAKKVKPVLKGIEHPAAEANYFGVKTGNERMPLLEHKMLEYIDQ